MQNKSFLGQGSVPKLIVRLAIPTILAQIVNLLYNIVDRIYIGHIEEVGGLAVTGVGICMPAIMIISAFAALIGYGGSPKASIYLGQKEDDKAEIVVGNSFILLIIIGIILTIIFIFFGENILYLFGATNNTIIYAMDYLNIYVIGTIFVLLTIGMNSFISAQGFTKISMITVLIGAILNCVLDPIFIYLFNFGVKGAAIATIISQCISAVFVIWFLSSKYTNLKLKFVNFKINFKIILPAILLGVSPFVMQFTEAVISICFTSSLKKYGDDVAIGAMTILSSLMQFSMLPLMGLSQGAQPVTSYNFGAKNTDRVRASFKFLLIISVIYSFILWALLMIFPSFFAGIITNDVKLVEYTSWAIRIYFAVSCLFSVQIACQQTLIAIGNAKVSVFLAVFRKIIILIPLIFILPSILTKKTMAIFLAEPIADAIAVTVTAVLFFVVFNKTLRKIENEKELA